jgi:ribosomal-protein-alanine N-acetyltransferase
VGGALSETVPDQVFIRPPRASDEKSYLAGVRASRDLHQPWVSLVATPAAFQKRLENGRSPRGASFFIFRSDSKALVGVVDLSEIVRGFFQSAYLGYFAFEPHAGRGLMREGLAQVVQHAFETMGLHRLEANVQPGNDASIALVRTVGFTKEGYSKRYLKIGGQWLDHERWAILVEDWRILAACEEGKDG